MGEVDKTYGAAYIGVCASLVLYGVTLLQMLVYIYSYPQDKVWNKLAVLWLLVLDTVHVVVSVYMMYWYLITNHGNPAELLAVHWTFEAMIILTTIVLPSVHALYTIRVCKLEATIHGIEGSFPFKPISIVTVLVFLSGIAASLTAAYTTTRLKYFTNAFLHGTRWATYYPLITATCLDVQVATALCYLLSRCRTGFKRTNTLVTWLIFYVINTKFLTGICSLAAVIMLTVLPDTFAVLSFIFILTKLYINSYMAMLNARTSLRSLECHPDGPEDIALNSRIMRLKASAPGNAKHSTIQLNNPVTASSRSQRAACIGAVTASERISTALSGSHHAEPEALEVPKVAGWEQSRGDIVWVRASKDPSRL